MKINNKPFSSRNLLLVAGILLIIGSYAINAYLYMQVKTLNAHISSYTPVTTSYNAIPSPTPAPGIEDSRVVDLESRIKSLEYKSSLIGKTVTACGVISDAYSKFGPQPEYSDKLGTCAATYQKLEKSL